MPHAGRIVCVESSMGCNVSLLGLDIGTVCCPHICCPFSLELPVVVYMPKKQHLF